MYVILLWYSQDCCNLLWSRIQSKKIETKQAWHLQVDGSHSTLKSLLGWRGGTTRRRRRDGGQRRRKRRHFRRRKCRRIVAASLACRPVVLLLLMMTVVLMVNFFFFLLTKHRPKVDRSFVKFLAWACRLTRLSWSYLLKRNKNTINLGLCIVNVDQCTKCNSQWRDLMLNIDAWFEVLNELLQLTNINSS